MQSSSRAGIYKASYEAAPGRESFVVVDRSGGRASRVDLVSDWLAELLAARRATNTLRVAADTLVSYWRWCAETGIDPRRTNSIQFSRYVLALQVVPREYPLTSVVRALPDDPRLRKPATVRLRVVYLKEFYRWAHRNGLVPTATATSIEGFRTPQAPKVMSAPRLSENQIGLLAEAPLHCRDRLIVELLFCAGLREGEALGLRIEDLCIDPQIADLFGCDMRIGAHLHVRKRHNPNRAEAKSRYGRVVPMIPRLTQALSDWNCWAYDNMPDSVESPYLLLSLRGKTRGSLLSISGFVSMWNDHVRAIEGLSNVNPHMLRHTFASELNDAGVEPLVIQELLGHLVPGSTSIYTHAHMNRLIHAVEQLADWRDLRYGEAGD